MSRLVAVLGVPHNPLLWRTMRADPVPDDLAATAGNFADFSRRLDATGADALVLIGSDHLRHFTWSNSPAFCVGKAETFACTHENEMRTFGLEPWEMNGDAELAWWLLGGGELPSEFDFAMSNEWVLDHSFTIPAVFLGRLALPIVPVHANAMIPPLPGAARFAALGRYLAERIASAPGERRVALVASGHLATEIGGPRQFLGGGSPDPSFDEEAVGWMAAGDVEAAVAACTGERLVAAGNATGQFLNFVAALAAAGRGAAFAEATPSRFANAPFFWWDA